ncbi:hypothetical protein ZWY2020_039817 [Hordeum vulgare]|nr:hypothetical protein ZWY2020_039817 [Hordeum vulgare]
MTKGQTSKMEARKKKNKAAAPAQRRRRPLPAGWIQGDFLPSTVTEGDLLELVEHGMLVHKSWRLPADDEVEPTPREGERVLLLSHAWTNWFSPVSNGNPEEEEEEGSQEGSVESAEYISDSGESEEEDSEEEEEDQEQDSPPPRPEHRTKRRHEPAVPSTPPASSSASPAAPVVPSVRGTKRASDAAAEPAGQSSRAPKPSGPKPRKALPRMRVAIPVTSTVATSATSPAHQGDDPMDTDNVVSSQPGAICLDEDDQGRADPVVEPVLEAAPPAATPAADAPPTEAPPPTEPVLKTCEMGTAYEALRAERNQFVGELDAAMLAMAGMKDALEGREKSLEKAREANKVLTKEVEKMKKQRTAWHNQMAVLNKRCIAQEKYVKDWAGQMMTRLADFCVDTEAEAAAVERSIKDNVPLGEDANRDLLRAHIRVGKEVREDKLKTLKVANMKKLRFEDFMETFLETATRIADGIDLDTFVEPSSPGAGPADA